MKKFKYDIDIYKQSVIFCFDIETFNDLTGGDRTNIAGGCGYHFNSIFDIVVYVGVVDGSIPVPVIAHECFHAMERIMQNSGVKYVEEINNESFAYLLELLTGKCLLAWSRYNK